MRWKAPVDVTPDDGVYEAYYYEKAPVQEVGDPAAEYGTSEDCLYLNVWRAADESTAKKPVIVWIYGGAFDVGGATDPMYDLTNFLNENPDVIVVTINYRINVFGFFHLSHLSDGKDYPDAQNLGLLDQLMALKWVHENITAFGGDPDNVTIWGESKLYPASAYQRLASVFQACHRTKWRSRPDEKYGAGYRMHEQPDGETRL